MRIESSVTMAAEPSAVRAVVADPERLAEALPNVSGFSWADEPGGPFEAEIRPALALGEIPVKTTWEPLAGDPVRYRVEGRTDEHRVAFDVTLTLEPGDDGGTIVDWSLDVHVTGTLRSAGQRVLTAIVAAQARVVLAAVEEAAR